MLTTWIADARYAARRLKARPGFTLLSVLTLSLGIGGTAAVYGIARPLIIDLIDVRNVETVNSINSSGMPADFIFAVVRWSLPRFAR